MDTKEIQDVSMPLGKDLLKRVWNESWTYIKTVVDIVHEPILILDENLNVRGANDSFYKTFQVDKRDTEGKSVYALGNGQWNIASLKKLLEDILPLNTFFNGYEVSHTFPVIGHKVMILNARQIHFDDPDLNSMFPSIILLAMDDVTEMMVIAESLASHTNKLDAKHSEKTRLLEQHIAKLEAEVATLRSKGRSGKSNGNA